jgi:hypothetical protein
VLDIHQCDRLPTREESQRIGRAAREVALGEYGWERLVSQLRAVVPAGRRVAARGVGARLTPTP